MATGSSAAMPSADRDAVEAEQHREADEGLRDQEDDGLAGS